MNTDYSCLTGVTPLYSSCSELCRHATQSDNGTPVLYQMVFLWHAQLFSCHKLWFDPCLANCLDRVQRTTHTRVSDGLEEMSRKEKKCLGRHQSVCDRKKEVNIFLQSLKHLIKTMHTILTSHYISLLVPTSTFLLSCLIMSGVKKTREGRFLETGDVKNNYLHWSVIFPNEAGNASRSRRRCPTGRRGPFLFGLQTHLSIKRASVRGRAASRHRSRLLSCEEPTQTNSFRLQRWQCSFWTHLWRPTAGRQGTQQHIPSCFPLSH